MQFIDWPFWAFVLIAFAAGLGFALPFAIAWAWMRMLSGD